MENPDVMLRSDVATPRSDMFILRLNGRGNRLGMEFGNRVTGRIQLPARSLILEFLIRWMGRILGSMKICNGPSKIFLPRLEGVIRAGGRVFL
jgi:hypothetical protein